VSYRREIRGRDLTLCETVWKSRSTHSNLQPPQRRGERAESGSVRFKGIQRTHRVVAMLRRQSARGVRRQQIWACYLMYSWQLSKGPAYARAVRTRSGRNGTMGLTRACILSSSSLYRATNEVFSAPFLPLR